MTNVSSIRTIRHDQRRHPSLQFVECFSGILRIAQRTRFDFVTEKKVRVIERLVQRIAEDLRDESLRTCDGDFRSMLFRKLDRFANRGLAGLRIGEHISFDEQPLRILDPLFFDMPVRQMARDGQTGAHCPFGVRRNDAYACSRRLINDDRISNIDTQFLELTCIEESVAIITNATDERGLPAQLRKGNDGVRYGAAADQLRLMLVKTLDQLL